MSPDRVREGDMLIPVGKDRPAVLWVDGWHVFVGVRDAAYSQTLRAFKRLIRDAHPDKGGSAAKVRHWIHERARWRNVEATWYAKVGLLPPDGYQQAKGVLARRRRLRGETP